MPRKCKYPLVTTPAELMEQAIEKVLDSAGAPIEMMRLREAEKQSGISQTDIKRFIDCGILLGHKLGPVYLLNRSDFNRRIHKTKSGVNVTGVAARPISPSVFVGSAWLATTGLQSDDHSTRPFGDDPWGGDSLAIWLSGQPEVQAMDTSPLAVVKLKNRWQDHKELWAQVDSIFDEFSSPEPERLEHEH